MPQDGANNYHYPLGTPGIPDQTIESEAYNTFIDDLVNNDLNWPRPIHRGGTGANTAIAALSNLGGEKSSQLVSDYDAHQFLPGSFYSAAGANKAPVDNHAFVGWVISSDVAATPINNQNVILHARDQSDTTGSRRVYIREKRNGVWLNLATNNGWTIDGTGIVGPSAPLDPPDNALWWDSESGMLFVYYNDGDTKQWVVASPQPDVAQFILKAGDTMTGALNVVHPPVDPTHAVSKKYVDDYGTLLSDSKVAKAGGAGAVMTGLLTLSGPPSAALHAATKAYADTKVPLSGNSTINGGITTTGGLAVGTNMTVGTTIGAGGLIQSLGRVLSGEAGGVFANESSFFGFNGDGTIRQFYFNNAGLLQFNVATADFSWIANPWGAMLLMRYADNAMILSGYAYKPGGGVWADASDARIKNVEGDYTRGLVDVAQLRPVLYTFKGNDTSDAPAHIRTGVAEDDAKKAKEAVVVPYPNSPHHASATQGRKFAGLIAQEVETVIPEMVKQRAGYIDGAAVSDLRDLDTTPLIFALVNAIKELKARVEALEAV